MSPLQPAFFPGIGGAELLILVVVFLVALKVKKSHAFAAFRERVSRQRIPNLDRVAKPHVVDSVRKIVGSWLAPTGVMAVFVVLSGAVSREPQSTVTVLAQNAWTLEPPQEVSSTHVTTIPPVDEPIPLRYGNNLESGKTLPGWIREGNILAGDIKRTVLSSQLWSTPDEAKKELLATTASLVRADFDSRHQSPIERASHRILTDDRIFQVAVKQQFVEQVEQDFGKFSAPMNRLWWQVEISPQVRTDLYPAWKSAVIGNRAIAIGVLLSLLTLLASSASLFSQLKTGSGRSSIFAATTVATSAAVWIGTDLLFAMQLCK